MTSTMFPQQHPFPSGPLCGGKTLDSPPSSPLPNSPKSFTKSASSLETGTGAASVTTSSTSGAETVSDISSAKEAVCFMGFPEQLVQLAIDIQRLDHGKDFTDASHLFLAVDDITQNPLKQAEYAKRLHDQAEKEKVIKTVDTVPVKLKETDIPTIEPAPCPAEMPEVVSSKPVSTHKSEKLQERVKALAKENQKLKKRKMCRACKKVELATSGITFLPCGHFITCEACSEMFDDCPACGKNVMGTVRTFLS